ncbi:uroporphyrinogen-III C-methyltransferase [Halofilum ochraceum]|uniref:uroporphyrinogen-III C-methyltransferase n=1 Tax=Halofilum ochraceum TaxID=1611323 RepID=UPI0008D9A93E|nr:uroporphyrinogen-III C-methyltransferase [Halofilum ochraceum]
MNDQRSDDDRRSDKPGPEESDERMPAPEESSDASTDRTEPDNAVEPDSGQPQEPDPESESGSREGADTDEAEPATADHGGEGSRDSSADDDGDGTDDGAAAAGPPRRRGGRWVLALALLIALVAAGAAGYLGWRLYRLEERVADIPAQRAAALEPLAERSALQTLERQFEQRLQAAVDDKADALISARDEALGEVRERLATLESGVEDIRELAARDHINWRLAEIRYLLAIAQRRVMIDRDVRSAVAALESADQAISEFGDVRLLPLRQRIVDNLSALRSVETADIEGIALRLQNLLGRVPELPAAGSRTTVTDATGDGTGAGGWWDSLVTRLDRFVTVRRREAAPEPGRPQPSTELPEADSLVLALERARSAALARDPAAYQRALERASTALDNGFETDVPVTERFREGLAWLRERPVEVELPDLAPTVDLAEKLSARIESSREDTPATGDEAED